MSKLLDELLKEKEEIEIQINLAQEIPDLEISTDRWGKERLSSVTANSMATDVDFIHSCGCCPDAVLYVMPYYGKHGHKIYSKPAQIGIGESNGHGSGQIAWKNWKENLKGFPEIIMEKAQNYFNSNPPEDYED